MEKTLTPEYINSLIPEVHADAVRRGFYNKCLCGDGKVLNVVDVDGTKIENDCPTCNGSGIYLPIETILMGIIEEIGEASRAYREGRFAKYTDHLDNFEYAIKKNEKQFKKYFEIFIKNTFEDKIADIFLCVLDLCGYLGIEYPADSYPVSIDVNGINVNKALWIIKETITNPEINLTNRLPGVPVPDTKWRQYWAWSIVQHIFAFCEVWNIDLQKHVQAKMVYNKTRGRK